MTDLDELDSEKRQLRLILELYAAFNHILELGKCVRIETSYPGETAYKMSQEDHPHLALKVGESIMQLCRAKGSQPGFAVLIKMHDLIDIRLRIEFSVGSLEPWGRTSERPLSPQEAERLSDLLKLGADVADTLHKHMQSQADRLNKAVADLPALLALPYKRSPFAQAIYDRLVESSRQLSETLAKERAQGAAAEVPEKEG
jgi:hypothetical protein